MRQCLEHERVSRTSLDTHSLIVLVQHSIYLVFRACFVSARCYSAGITPLETA
jgi:hypothetical protein